MWPFGSGKDEDSSKLVDELLDNLKGYFQKVDKSTNHDSSFEPTEHHKIVDKVLSDKSKQGYSYELEKYKRENSRKKVIEINCSEMQQKVIECLKGWNLTKTTHCQDEFNSSRQCEDLQSKALNDLFYNDCVDVQQCDKIRYAVDKFFTKDFGQFGENINPETTFKFDHDISKAFDKIWK